MFTIYIPSSIPNLKDKDHKAHNKSDRYPRSAKIL